MNLIHFSQLGAKKNMDKNLRITLLEKAWVVHFRSQIGFAIYFYIFIWRVLCCFLGGVGWCLGVCSEKPWLEDNALGFHSALFILVLKRCCACSCIYCVEPSLATKVTLQWKTQEGTIWEKQPNALTDLINYRFYRKSCE